MTDPQSPGVDPAALDALIAKAGISEGTANALRQANDPAPASTTSSVPGHGAPAEDHTDFGEL